MAEGFAGYLLKPVRQGALAGASAGTARPNLPAPDRRPAPSLLEAANAVLRRPTETAADGGRAGRRAPAPAGGPGAQPRGRRAQAGLTILLAEDNPINMLLIRELLRRRGHDVVEVTTGTDAVRAMAERRFDLLLTDIHMPGMDGIEAARAIRKDEAAPGAPRVPIVALTADAMETGKRACQEAGMDGFLTKPVDPAELEEMFLMLFPSEEGPLIVAA